MAAADEKPRGALALCEGARSQLLIIDVQERLAAAMEGECLRRLFSSVGRLIEAARILEIPITVTEQYPQGLGPTRREIAAQLPPGLRPCEKRAFSCCAAPGFASRLAPKTARPQVILTGMEAHICVLQTAAGLQGWGYQVFVAADGLCSRDGRLRENALQRLRQGGVSVTNSESVVFEWLGGADHPLFRRVSRLFR